MWWPPGELQPRLKTNGQSSSKSMVNEQHNSLPLSLSHIRTVESLPTEVSLKTQVPNENQDLVMCKKIL